MIENVVDRKLVEEKQRQSEIIVSSTTGIIALLDKNYTYLTVNPAYLRILKKTYEQVIGEKAITLFGEAFFNKVIKPNGDRCLRGEEVHFEEWFDFPASGKRYMEIHYYPHFGVNNEIKGFVVSGRDITDRKQAEEELAKYQIHLEEQVKERTFELKKSETSLINLISNLNGMVYSCKNDKNWTMNFVSSGSLELTGYKPEDLEKNNVISFNTVIHPDDREAVWDEVQKALKNKVPFILNYRITTLEGKLKYVWEQGRGVWSNSGELEGLQGFITDITKQVDAEQKVKNSQAQLIHMEKLSALGKLTGSISHEFNNPLQGIRSTIANLSKSTLSDKEVKLAKAGKKECDRMAKMIKGLRDFYRPTSGKVSSININQSIEEVLILQIKSMQEQGIQINQQFSDNLPEVEVVEDQIKQVILNLIQNAKDSISGEGQITLTTKKQGTHLKIEIQDTGHGISADEKKNLFEPFYTTKNKEQGTGLGLSISYGIIQDHGGDIEVKSELDKGTTITVSLPIKRK
jgi:PAS domain S-box-containing protein